MQTLTATLASQMQEAYGLVEAIKLNLQKIGFELQMDKLLQQISNTIYSFAKLELYKQGNVFCNNLYQKFGIIFW